MDSAAHEIEAGCVELADRMRVCLPHPKWRTDFGPTPSRPRFYSTRLLLSLRRIA